MRLLTKTTLYFLLVMIPLLAIAGYFLFNQLNQQINQRADKELVNEEVQWVNYLEATTGKGSSFVLQTPELLIYPTDKSIIEYPQLSTVYVNLKDKIKIPFRQLNDVVNINGVPYEIVIRKSQEQKLALVTNVITIMLFVFAGLLLATLIFNWILNKKLWQPFQNSLQKIRNIELPKVSTIRFENTNTKEFNELNASLNLMADKIHSDYVNMKEFTEDAAHEMQTPLAVAQTKMELLLQDANLTSPQTDAIMQAAASLERLRKLNQSLLLLAKIENNQYEASDSIDLVEVTKKFLKLFDELINEKQLSIETNFAQDFKLKLHPFLAESLISNLVGNAIKYNYEGGKVVIGVDNNQFCISNSSHNDQIDPQQLFKRFTGSANKNSSSTGLGLAIVKKIVDTHHLMVSYVREREMHQFCIRK